MDYGTLTDNNGRKADFRNVIIVMTTNAGTEQMSRNSVGFVNQDHSGDDREVINKLFTPEFRNRLDSIIRFGSLDEETILEVAGKFVLQLEEQLADKHVSLRVEDSARQWLAKHGHDPSMGARPMSRLIRDRINQALADELLFGKFDERRQRAYFGQTRRACIRDRAPQQAVSRRCAPRAASPHCCPECLLEGRG